METTWCLAPITLKSIFVERCQKVNVKQLTWVFSHDYQLTPEQQEEAFSHKPFCKGSSNFIIPDTLQEKTRVIHVQFFFSQVGLLEHANINYGRVLDLWTVCKVNLKRCMCVVWADLPRGSHNVLVGFGLTELCTHISLNRNTLIRFPSINRQPRRDACEVEDDDKRDSYGLSHYVSVWAYET